MTARVGLTVFIGNQKYRAVDVNPHRVLMRYSV